MDVGHGLVEQQCHPKTRAVLSSRSGNKKGGEHTVNVGCPGRGQLAQGPKVREWRSWQRKQGPGPGLRDRTGLHVPCVPATRGPTGTAGAAPTGWGYLAAVRAARDQEWVPGSRGRRGRACCPLGPGAARGSGLTGHDADSTPCPVGSAKGTATLPAQACCPQAKTLHPEPRCPLLSPDSPARWQTQWAVTGRPRPSESCLPGSQPQAAGPCGRSQVAVTAHEAQERSGPAAARGPVLEWSAWPCASRAPGAAGPGLCLGSDAKPPSEGLAHGPKPRSSPRAGSVREFSVPRTRSVSYIPLSDLCV